MINLSTTARPKARKPPQKSSDETGFVKAEDRTGKKMAEAMMIQAAT